MISVSKLSIHFGGTYLFNDVSFLINSRDRVGLTGKNGAGKSTLLKILSGIQQPEKGEVARPSGATVGYLPQEMEHSNGKTIFEETKTAFVEAQKLEAAIHHLNNQLTIRTDYESDGYMDIIHKLDEANTRFMFIGGYSIDADIELVLIGLGFSRNDFTRLTEEFSGGWRMRVELAKILLQKPDVLLLDEPTNHLDIESIQWLEEFLKDYYGAVVLVSHDKTFLDNITTRTIEISLGKIYDYKANYSKYLQLRQERRDHQMAEAANQEKVIEHTEALINKYRAKANKAAFAQSLIKKLDRMDRVEVDEEDTKSIRFRFPPSPRSGKVVIEAENLEKYYGHKNIFKHISYLVGTGERIAFVGKNGEGKSTMLKIIASEIPHGGKLKFGHNVALGYYAQNQSDMLDGDKTVFETIDEEAKGDIRKDIRSLLGSFLFSGDTVDKKVKVLSGGEKSRLALCRLLLNPINLLVLDEPTNHLDMRSKDMLKTALMQYDGALIVVSHDRDFLNGLTDKIYEFKNGNVKEHYGDIFEFLKSKKIEKLAELDIKQKKDSSDKKEVKAKKDDAAQELKKEKEREQKNLQNKISHSEAEITSIEKEIKSFDEMMLNPETFKEVTAADKSVFDKYETLQKQLKEEMERWEALMEMADEF